jgi:hypothetical protein
MVEMMLERTAAGRIRDFRVDASDIERSNGT